MSKDFFRLSKRERAALFTCIGMICVAISISLFKYHNKSLHEEQPVILTPGSIPADSIVSSVYPTQRDTLARKKKDVKKRKRPAYKSPGSRDYLHEPIN